MKTLNVILVSVLGLYGRTGAAREAQYPLTVQPTVGGDLSAAPATGVATRSGDGSLTIRFHNTCYGTNLRNVHDPLHPDSVLIVNFSASLNGVAQKIKLSYPASIVTPTGIVHGSGSNKKANAALSLLRRQMKQEQKIQAFELVPEAFTAPQGSRAAVFGNVAQIEIPMTGVFATDDSGQIKRVGKMPSLGSFRFSQEMPNRTSPMQTLFGSSGAIGFQTSLTGSVDAVAMASDGSSIDVNLSFPGSRGFCGGYKSPLMLFFGEDRPLFKGISDFPIHPGKKTYWPEPGSAGYFLALDRDGNGRIDQRDELFGDQDKGGNNGFVELSKFDRNKDGIIDKKDAVYKRLRLWADADGDGVSTPQEMKTLQEMRVESISLDYERNSVRPIGQAAEERQKSTFRFRTQDGVLQTGSIVDIWLKSP